MIDSERDIQSGQSYIPIVYHIYLNYFLSAK
jgi:hypothetical protein